MKKNKVIKMTNLPTRLPIVASIAWWLFMDRLNVSPVAWGVFYTLAAIIWALSIFCVFNQENVDLFDRGAK
jgi:hypothetical protein